MAPVVSCKCKVAKCAICYNCARCQCEHDGLSVPAKIARTRGGSIPKSQKLKRSIVLRKSARLGKPTFPTSFHTIDHSVQQRRVRLFHFAFN
jgi:hypothetical protein